jgi:hypothetical protein
MNAMGTGFRFFLVEENDSLQKLSMARYYRLLRREPGERFSQYAGKRVRCVMVVLKVEGRIPLSITRIDYYFLPFDTEGRINNTELEKEKSLVVEITPPLIEEQSQENVLNARSRFAKKRYQHEFVWTPTQEIQAAIFRAIFGEDSA